MIDYISRSLKRAVQYLWWSGAGITLSDRHTIAHKLGVSLDEVDAAIEWVRNNPGNTGFPESN